MSLTAYRLARVRLQSVQSDAGAVDLLDLHGNTDAGIHIASAGGAWLALVAGFGGLRDSDGEVGFRRRAGSRLTDEPGSPRRS